MKEQSMYNKILHTLMFREVLQTVRGTQTDSFHEPHRYHPAETQRHVLL